MEKILIVDDVELNRELLKMMLCERYETLEAEDGDQAISIIESEGKDLSLIFLDLVMPKKSGMDVLWYMNVNGYIKYIPVILITGESTPESEEKAYSLGASEVIYKPFSARIVMRRTENIIELYKEKNYIEEELRKRTEALIESQDKLRHQNEFLINALSSVVEFRNLESGEHILRVKEFTKVMLKYIRVYFPQYGITEEDAEYIVSASTLHDLGKIAIPDNVLLKAGRLTDEEFEIIKKHTIYGAELLERFGQSGNKLYDYSYEICKYHHERYDGKGYPEGLVGEEIPVSAQIISIVDVFDALVSKRVYKDSFAMDDAYMMIMNGECGLFGPNMLECFKYAKNDLFKMAHSFNRESR